MELRHKSERLANPKLHLCMCTSLCFTLKPWTRRSGSIAERDVRWCFAPPHPRHVHETFLCPGYGHGGSFSSSPSSPSPCPSPSPFSSSLFFFFAAVAVVVADAAVVVADPCFLRGLQVLVAPLVLLLPALLLLPPPPPPPPLLLQLSLGFSGDLSAAAASARASLLPLPGARLPGLVLAAAAAPARRGLTLQSISALATTAAGCC